MGAADADAALADVGKDGVPVTLREELAALPGVAEHLDRFRVGRREGGRGQEGCEGEQAGGGEDGPESGVHGISSLLCGYFRSDFRDTK